MKKILILLFIGFYFVGCKKYENDPFISTYSPEARLTKGDSCVWTCVKYKNNNGIISNVPAFHYSLSLNKNKTGSTGFLDLGNFFEISNSQIWSLVNNKKTFNFFGNFQINKLTINELELKDNFNNLYYFEKRKKQAITYLDKGILNIPIYGIFSETVKLVEFESGEFGEIDGKIGGTPMTSITGIVGKGEGTSGFEINATYNFGRNFSKPGYITFWMRNYSLKPIIKINGQVINNYTTLMSVDQEIDEWNHKYWEQVLIKVTSGIKMINISNFETSGGVKSGINGLDEIRYWEIIE
jgi:hypothetical protein